MDMLATSIAQGRVDSYDNLTTRLWTRHDLCKKEIKAIMMPMYNCDYNISLPFSVCVFVLRVCKTDACMNAQAIVLKENWKKREIPKNICIHVSTLIYSWSMEQNHGAAWRMGFGFFFYIMAANIIYEQEVRSWSLTVLAIHDIDFQRLGALIVSHSDGDFLASPNLMLPNASSSVFRFQRPWREEYRRQNQ